MYTEPQLLETLERLMQIYLESYPDDQEAITRFSQWIFSQYGYKHGKS
jgi:hypothetical protein